jgi:uncharacterized membrane protein YedE/YeeE
MVGNAMTGMVATLLIGLLLGYLGQRSRMCFVGGIRDFMLVRDTDLLKGLLGFGLVAWVAFPLAVRLVGSDPVPSGVDGVAIAMTGLGALVVGYVSTLANGCPFRQHVLAAQGVVSSLAYLVGFFVGAVAFHWWVEPTLGRLLP